MNVAIKQVKMQECSHDEEAVEERYCSQLTTSAVDPAYLHQLTREVCIHSFMDHDNIVKYLGHVQSQLDPRMYTGLMMEYCPPMETDFEDSVTADIPTLLTFLQQALLAMKHVHSKTFVHLDIKADNFLDCVGSDSSLLSIVVKLADFGHAMRTGAVITCLRGTPTHMPPELLQIDAEDTSTHVRATAAQDVFSFGVTVIEVLCKAFHHQSPSTFDGLLSMMQMHADNESTQEFYMRMLDDQSNLRLECSPWLREFIKGCLEHAPEKRTSVDELLHQVQNELQRLDQMQALGCYESLQTRTLANMAANTVVRSCTSLHACMALAPILVN
jgi:serine/threonine protein kinase